MRVILASGSPRRKELIKEVVKEYEIIKSEFDEESLKDKIKNPKELVKQLAYEKAEEVYKKLMNNASYCNDDFAIVSADTIVVFNNAILGKPKDEEDAFLMLKKLQGNENFIYTAMCVIINKCYKNKEDNIIKQVKPKKIVDGDISKVVVTMKKMSDKEILDYIETKDPLDKAGAYAVQGIGSKNIEKIEGNFNAGVGLNIDSLKEIFKRYNVV